MAFLSIEPETAREIQQMLGNDCSSPEAAEGVFENL